MIVFLALGLLWSAIFTVLYSSSQLRIENVLTIVPATLLRFFLPILFGLISGRLAPRPFELSLLYPTLTLSVYLFTQSFIRLKDSPTRAYLSKMLAKNSFFIRHYDILTFYSTLLFVFIIGL